MSWEVQLFSNWSYIGSGNVTSVAQYGQRLLALIILEHGAHKPNYV